MIPIFSLFKDLLPKVAMNFTTVTNGNTKTAGVILDCLGVSKALLGLILHAVTDGTYTVSVEQGDASNLSDYAGNTMVAGVDTNGALPVIAYGEGANITKTVEVFPKKRYIRMDVTQAAGTSGGKFSGVALLHPNRMPVQT